MSACSLLSVVIVTLGIGAIWIPVAQGSMHNTVAPAIISGNSVSSCPSEEERQIARQLLSSEVNKILADAKPVPQCGAGLWRQVANLNMNDPSQQCPASWMEINSNGTRACGRNTSSSGSCPAKFYGSGGQHYSRVCGRIIGYQIGSPAAFYPGSNLGNDTLDGIYVDGVSVTHGTPRSHIWTYAAGTSEEPNSAIIANCPCLYNASNSGIIHPPVSIQQNFYCESGNSASDFTLGLLYDGDPLWDGKQCEGQCCSSGLTPPWFSVTLPKLTADDLEVRICGDQDTHDEDNPISLLELYIQ